MAHGSNNDKLAPAGILASVSLEEDDFDRRTSASTAPSMLVVLQEEPPPEGRESKKVAKVIVRTGRHVDNITFVYSDKSTVRHGQPGGETQPAFDVNYEGGEFIVRIVGRQGDLLDGVQFITNFGSRSEWFGGRGGESFSYFAQKPGLPIVNIVSENSKGFCPRVAGVVAGLQAPEVKRRHLIRVLFQRNVIGLMFKGKPSLFRQLLSGRPSLLRETFRGRPSLFRLLISGDECLLRVFVDGEHFKLNPHSLLRTGATVYPGFDLSPFNLFIRRRKGETESVAQLMFKGKSSLFRLLFQDNPNSPDGKSIAHWMFRRDETLGRPSLLQLMLEGETKGRPCLLRLLLVQEGDDSSSDSRTRKSSLLRVMVSGSESVLRQIMQVGDGSLTHRLLREDRLDSMSLARTFFTDPLNAKPSLARYFFSGEEYGRDSVMRLFMRGDGPHSSHPSLMDLLCQPYADQPPLLEVLSAGEPSIIDLLMRGEEQGERSLARVFLGTAIKIEGGAIRAQGALKTDEDGKEPGWTLAKVALAGEEVGGPGLSMMRLFLFGENRGDISLLRLMLTNEQDGSPSFLRALITGLQAGLIAANTGTTNVNKWQGNAQKIVDAVKGSTQEGVTWKDTIGKILTTATSTSQWQQQFLQISSILSNMSEQDSKFKEEWRKTWGIIGDEIAAAGTRARPGTMWQLLGPQGQRVARAMASQNFVQVVSEVATLISTVDRINRERRQERRRQKQSAKS